MQICVTVCVRSTYLTASSQAQDTQGAAANTASGQSRRADERGRARSHARRAARLHANAGSGSTRHQPLDLQPARPAIRRAGRDAVGLALDSGRRAAAVARRAPQAGSSASGAKSEARTPRQGRGRRRRPNPGRARRRQQSRSDRARAHRRPDADSPRWHADGGRQPCAVSFADPRPDRRSPDRVVPLGSRGQRRVTHRRTDRAARGSAAPPRVRSTVYAG